jgi:phage terminase large subunit-like protein
VTRGELNCRWIEKFCRVPEGRLVGTSVTLRPWQRELICEIYDNPARTRRAIVSFGKKNGKTSLSAFLLLLHLVGPEARERPNSQLFSAAQSRDQAAVLFALAAKTVRMSEKLAAAVVIRDSTKQLACPKLGTLYRALSAEASTAHGLSPALIVHDELGQVRGPRSELYEALELAAGAQEDPLSIVISTQAPDAADLLSVLIDDARSGADPRVKLFLYTADPAIDPFGEEAIRAANPAYGDFLNPSEVRDQAENARRMPAREAAYRNLVLNQRIDAASPFISPSVWDACAGAPDHDALRTARVWIGLDLSARNDLTALVAVGQDADGLWHVLPRFFAPQVALHDRSRRDRAPYDLWARDGLITATPGASVDYSIVARALCELCDDFDVAGIAFDRWRIDVLKHEIGVLDRELPLVPFGQGFKDMSPALDVLESELLQGRLRHGAHPVLSWCVSNATVSRDPAGNRKLDKSKSTARIDGAVALAMALGAAKRAAPQEKPFMLSDDYELLLV